MKTITTKQRILNATLTRILLGLVVCFIAFILAQQVTGKLLDLTVADKNYRNLIKGIISSAAVVLAYIYFFKKYEKRTITEFSSKGMAKYIITGVIVGVLLQSLTILVIILNGSFEIVSINPFSDMIIPFTVAFSVAIFEEILIRGIIFRIVEEKLGSYISLLITAIIFGALHLANPNSTLMSGLCVGIEAGFLMGTAYIYSRNLWFPIAIHFAWNFMQSGIFGAITSGNKKTSSLLTTKIAGSQLFTGGEFGPEGTIQAIIFCSLASIVLLILSGNKIISPHWRK
ncbi:CPBP family intramembrane glutamic endopeptidase [Flavobacterium psychrotolerans]|uniref:CPBP family intramembrane metalloprotease domain-containing protein n=1 Tax=Flavobacterium psychrotolerans TaxID=2169410 RepID=A0A2U1JFP7_9FLAO|nr:type II CAAX endopeptidase family protein [Flavobacterium psychrotolerans]PWA03931.1 CPBP family intramembrane metalloprotease domain-containing protein [Flavobacterium psychrotolerans]